MFSTLRLWLLAITNAHVHPQRIGEVVFDDKTSGLPWVLPLCVRHRLENRPSNEVVSTTLPRAHKIRGQCREVGY